jgi:hypothetical protein
MGSLAVLLLATPLFGFQLSAPALSSLDVSARTAAEVQASEPRVSADGPAADTSSDNSEQAQYKRDLKRRDDIAGVHRAFGVTTWASMTLTVAFGVMSYYNLYGFGANQGSNPCVTGHAIGGDGGCNTMQALHGISAGLTTALYATTFTLSLMMPDPDDLASGKGDFAKTLRLHKTLRWVHLGGMIAQALIGIVIANNWLGLDRANNYKALQTLATVHLASGVITYGALTWAGALMTF